MGVAGCTKIQMQLEKHIKEGFHSKSMELKWVRRRRSSNNSKSSQIDDTKLLMSQAIKSTFPIYISTNPQHVDPHELQKLCADCNHSCHRFPNFVNSHGVVVESVDIHKLRVALSHSAVLASVFCKPHHVVDDGDGGGDFTSAADSPSSIIGMADFLQSVTPVTPFDGRLVGFGRAVSDFGLTGSIYDVMVTIVVR